MSFPALSDIFVAQQIVQS